MLNSNGKWTQGILACLFIISVIAGFIFTLYAYQQGYQTGKQDGYSQGQSDGYTQGYNAAGGATQSWISQNCFNYPFLLLDTSQYMACHRYSGN